MKPFLVTMAAEPTAPRVMRGRLREWLDSYSWPDDELGAIVYAVSEAVSNCVEHAYPGRAVGEVTVTGQLEIVADPAADPAAGRGEVRRMQLAVIDQGSWRVTPESSEGRRRGLPLIKALMHTVTIHHHNLADWYGSAALQEGAAQDRSETRDGSFARSGTTVVLLSTTVPLLT